MRTLEKPTSSENYYSSDTETTASGTYTESLQVRVRACLSLCSVSVAKGLVSIRGTMCYT